MGTTTCIKEQCIGPGCGAVGSGGGGGGDLGWGGQSLVLSSVFVSSTDPRLQAVGDGQTLSRRGHGLSGWRHLVDKQPPPPGLFRQNPCGEKMGFRLGPDVEPMQSFDRHRLWRLEHFVFFKPAFLKLFFCFS